jgi:mannose-6-phosphate isomerase
VPIAPRRVRVQARQIYCFAKAAQLGWYPEGAEIARKGLDYLLAKAKSPDGRPGFVHLLAPDGAVLNPLRDTHDHAFVLLALAALYQLNGDAQVRAEIDSLMQFFDTVLRSPDGGYSEGVPATLPRRQNPQMHVFEALIATFDATHDQSFQARAGELFGLFVANLYDGQKQVLGEYFEQDWSRIEPACVEPGHQAEWVWLLKGFERITGCPTPRAVAGLGAALPRSRHRAVGGRGRCARQHPKIHQALLAPDRDGQGMDRAGRSRRGGRRRRRPRGAATPAPALPDAPGGWRLV